MKPIAVVISDIHFNLNTLLLATAALKAALDKAASLRLPLIIAGDLHDTKAIIRAEVANTLLNLLEDTRAQVYILVGNHDLINEKGEGHGLTYLNRSAMIIESPMWLYENLHLIPYFSDQQKLPQYLSSVKKGSTLIMHQGFQGANLGDYVQDKTSISPDLVKDFTVISGHYHRHQTIGTVTYIGSPYTMTFGEANDGPKGFLILNDDGTYTREILNLRKHVIVECHIDELAHTCFPDVRIEDLVWFKVHGPESELNALNKHDLGMRLLGHTNFKLDLIPDKVEKTVEANKTQLTDMEILNKIIGSISDTDEQKVYLKELSNEILGS